MDRGEALCWRPMQPSPDQSPDRRVTVIEAATILGITPDAVRARLRRGTLRRGEAENGTVLVILGDGDGRDGPDASATDRPTDRTTVALVEALQDQIAYLRQQAELWQEEARRKDHLLAAALERIPAIEEAPPEPRDGPETGSDARGGADAPPEPEKRSSWWRRLFGG